ncbi:hypothetical protein HGG75_09970 [Ochrobactrum pseudogrignonense]|nr:hypothetical protein [Brucella pseudogrignonensis]
MNSTTSLVFTSLSMKSLIPVILVPFRMPVQIPARVGEVLPQYSKLSFGNHPLKVKASQISAKSGCFGATSCRRKKITARIVVSKCQCVYFNTWLKAGKLNRGRCWISLFWYAGLEGKGVKHAAHVALEGVIDHLVLLHA